MSPFRDSTTKSTVEKGEQGQGWQPSQGQPSQGQPSQGQSPLGQSPLGQSPLGPAASLPQFSLQSLLLGFTLCALICGLMLILPAFISQILIGAIWIASAGWLITGICFAQGDQRAFCIGACIVIASMWTGVGARFVEGMTSLLASILGGWTSSGQIARWIELVLLLLAAIANGRLAVRARHYYERAKEP